jgi:MarR family transcriptional regulator, 2-MHQ and catechol-resistance regulon repressor
MKHATGYGRKADLALKLWVKLSRAHSSFARLSTRNIAQYGLTVPQFAVLECLGHCGPLKQTALSRKMLVSGGNMTVVVDNLEKEGLVRRADDPHDRRAFIVCLTVKGKKLFDGIFKRHAAFVARTASVLTESEQVELSRLLKKLGLGLQEPH